MIIAIIIMSLAQSFAAWRQGAILHELSLALARTYPTAAAMPSDCERVTDGGAIVWWQCQ